MVKDVSGSCLNLKAAACSFDSIIVISNAVKTFPNLTFHESFALHNQVFQLFLSLLLRTCIPALR